MHIKDDNGSGEVCVSEQTFAWGKKTYSSYLGIYMINAIRLYSTG